MPAKQLMVTYNIHDGAVEYILDASNARSIDLEWIELTVGTYKKAPLVLARASRQTFLLADDWPPSTPDDTQYITPWVYAIEAHSDEFLGRKELHTCVKHDAFSVVHGVDRSGREFAYVEMPTQTRDPLIILFRDPGSADPEAWSTPVAITLNHLHRVREGAHVRQGIEELTQQDEDEIEELIRDLESDLSAPHPSSDAS